MMSLQWIHVWLVIVGLGLTAETAWGQALEERNIDTPPNQSETPTPANAPVADVQAARELIVQQTNEFRQQHGFEAVKTDPRLMQTAQDFAEFMARTNKYGHTADGQRPGQRATGHGYDYCIIAENIAYQYNPAGITTEKLADRFVTGWKNSREHRKNMLDPDVTETGVGVAYSQESGAYFAVQMFGRPKAKDYQFQVTNRSDQTVRYTVAAQDSQRTFTLPPRVTRTHQRCRPSKVDFAWTDRHEALEPGANAHYVVVAKPAGKLEVQKQ